MPGKDFLAAAVMQLIFAFKSSPRQEIKPLEAPAITGEGKYSIVDLLRAAN